MKIKGEKRQCIISALATVSGEIIYADRIINDIMGKVNPDYTLYDILPGTDSDISMLSSPAFITSRIEGYTNGIISTIGSGIGKHLELVLIGDDPITGTEDRIGTMIRALSIFKDDEDKRIFVNLAQLICDAVGYGNEITGKLDIELSIDKEKEILADPVCFIALFISLMKALSGIISTEHISISSTETDYGEKISVISTTEDTEEIYGIYDFCNAYPSASSSLAFIRAICNKKGIELLVGQRDGLIEIGLNLPSGNLAEFSVYNHLYSDLSKEISEALSIIFNNGSENY